MVKIHGHFTDDVIVADEADDENDYYLAPKGPPSKQSCTDVTGLVIFIAFFSLCTGVVFYTFSKGNPSRLFYPTNSAGEICGQGNQTGKPNLLYFSLTRCAGLSAAVGGCPTPQVCVEECPRTYWTSAQGKSSGLEQFCDNVTSSKMEDTTISLSRLVAERSCPAYVLPSTSVMGRCVPTFGVLEGEQEGKEETKINFIKTEDGEVLRVEKLRQGFDYVMNSIDNRKHDWKSLASLYVYWRNVLLSFFLALFLSLSSMTVLIKLAAKPFLWTTILICMAFSIAGNVSSIVMYSQIMTVGVDIFLPPVITSMPSYTWLYLSVILGIINLITVLFLGLMFRKINLAIMLIQIANKDLNSMKSVLWIPIVQSVIQVLLILLFVTVESFWATSGSPEYRVVDACSSETCVNMATLKMFVMNDVCDPGTFVECTGCPRAQCVFHKFGSSVLGFWPQVLSFLLMLWSLFFVKSLGSMIIGGAFAGLYWNLSSTGAWSSFKKTYRYHLGTVVCGSFVPLVFCMKSGVRCLNMSGFVITAVHGESFWAGSKIYVSLLDGNSDRLLGLDIVVTFILFTAKLFIVGFAVTFAAFSIQFDCSLESRLNYQILPLLIIIVGSYAIISNFLSFYSMAVETMLLRFLEDAETMKDNSYFKSSDLKQILEWNEHGKGDEIHPLKPGEEDTSWDESISKFSQPSPVSSLTLLEQLSQKQLSSSRLNDFMPETQYARNYKYHS